MWIWAASPTPSRGCRRCTPSTLAGTVAHMPMLLRHGLAADAKDDVAANPPHE
jgi:hypothetical protein